MCCAGRWTMDTVSENSWHGESVVVCGVRWRPEAPSRTPGSCRWCARWPLRPTTPRGPCAPDPPTPAAAPLAQAPSCPAAYRTCCAWPYARLCPTARSLPRARGAPVASWMSLRNPLFALAPRVWMTAPASSPRTARRPTVSTTPSSRRVSLHNSRVSCNAVTQHRSH